jgi:nicotinamide-nucleotide amidase
MKAEIIAIGDEILIGQVVDTNSSWIAGRLNELGIEVSHISVISDAKEDIKESISKAINRSDIIIVTGGLGPTNDDITKHTLAELFNTDLVLNQYVLENIKALFKNRGIALNKQNRGQAYVPENCKVLNNIIGTAPGMWFSENGKELFSLPGVPFEMKSLMENEVLPKLKDLNSGSSIIVNQTVNVYNIPESVLAEKIEEWEINLPDNMSLAYLPSPHKIRLRLTARGANREELLNSIADKFQDLTKYVPVNAKITGNETIEQSIGKLLKERNLTLSTAESCTGGNIAHMVTSVAGSSEYFIGSVVAYSNFVKENILKVNKEDIETYGAVSKSVVEQMAEGVRKILCTDYSVATSGIAGPTGGTDDKPVGTVWIAVSSEKRTISKKFVFSNNRDRNIGKSSVKAIDMLINEIIEND